MSPQPIRVLLIEDDEDDYVLVREALKGLGAEQVVLDWLDDPAAGLETLCEGRHDVCLLDYHLGSWTGAELLSQARQRGCRVPVILMSGTSDSQQHREALEAGAVDVVVKSEASTELLERVIRSLC
jgi:DNA-binding response OmpR family regulator